MTFTQPRQLIAAALIAAVLSYVIIRLIYGSIPTLPSLAGVTLLVIAVVEVVFAFMIRPRVRRDPGTEPVEPLTAGRAVALAKASSMAGSIMSGLWIGLLVYLIPLRELAEAAKSDTVAAIIGLVSAVALIGAGLWLEYCLRNPDDPDELDED